MSAEGPQFDGPNSLVTAIVQDASSGKVLMLAHMNQAAWQETIETGYAVFFSRSRQKLWRKGEISGHIQAVREIYVDCDGDAVLLKVDQTGAACHEGYESCFFRRLEGGQWRIISERMIDPADVYLKSREAEA